MRRLTWFMVFYVIVLLLASTGLFPGLGLDDMRGKSMMQAEENFLSISFYRYVSARPVWAAELTFTPTLDVTQEYNDNILFEEDIEVDDLITIVTPQFHGSLAGKYYSVTAGGFLRGWEYRDENDFDTIDTSIDLSIALQPTPRLKTRASGSYLEDTTQDAEIEATGVILTRDDRWRTEGSTGLSYLLGERTTLDFDYTHRRVEYEAFDLVDYKANVYGVSMARLMKNERDAISALFYVSDYDFDPNTAEDYGGTLTYLYQIREWLSLQLGGGARWTRTFIETTTGTIRDEEWGGLADIALTGELERGTATIGYLSEVVPTGEGEVVAKNRVFFNGSYRFTERITVGLYADYFDSESVGDITRTDQDFYRVGPSLKVRLWERVHAQLVYEHARSCDDIDDTDIDRDRIFLTLTATWPLKYYSP